MNSPEIVPYEICEKSEEKMYVNTGFKRIELFQLNNSEFDVIIFV